MSHMGMAFDFSSVLPKNMESIMNQKFSKAFKKIGKGFKKHFMLKEDDVEGIAMVRDALGGITSSVLNIIGVILQLLDAIGVLQPIMDIFSGVLAKIGGGVMEKLVPAIDELAQALFSDEMMKLWGTLGEAIGTFVGTILSFIASLFSDPEMFTVLKAFGKAILGVINALSVAVGWLFDVLGGMSASDLGKIFYAIAIGLAFLIGLMYGGPLGLVLGAAAAIATGIALAPLLELSDGGIVTRPTFALIGEDGPEAVIPLSSEGGFSGTDTSNQELLWATEDNGDRLDKLIRLLNPQNRIDI